MQNIIIDENGMRVSFRINENKNVELVDFSALGASQDLQPLTSSMSGLNPYYQCIAVQVTGECATDMHANRHNAASEGGKFKYVSHHIHQEGIGKKLHITMKTDQGLKADYYMQFYKDIPIVRTWTSLTNVSDEAIGIDYVSSFIYEGIGKNGNKKSYEKTNIHVPYNSWSNEAQWQSYEAEDLGLSWMALGGYNNPDMGNTRFHYANCGSWSSCEYLPMGLAEDKESGETYYFQIEHSGSWMAEYGQAKGKNIYLALMGPNDESAWWKSLEPSASFTTVPVAVGVCQGGLSQAIGNLTKYRRVLRRPNKDDEACFVVFNDYMNCLMGDPTEEKEKEIIEKAAEIGCEYYCMDCGWYDKGAWWDRVGEWEESVERFPNGMKTVCDYARDKGMNMGLWLEIEVMGTACDLANTLPDDWFICNHGKRRIDNKRYLLDFRNPKVREYCRKVIDRLIRDYGVSYFKIDYNVTTGPGSDLETESMGQAMLDHYRALYHWYEEIYRDYPDLIIENCGSGGQRMDYGLLALHSLQSTSDQTDYIANSYIAANVASAVTPEQAGMWVYPYKDEAEHVIYNMVNGLLLRPYMSGLVWNISQDNLALMKEGIDVYKGLRKDLIKMNPFFPLGFGDVKKEALAYGLMDDRKAYLAVFGAKTDKVILPIEALGKKVKDIKVIYPSTYPCDIEIQGDKIVVDLPQQASARLLELDF